MRYLPVMAVPLVLLAGCASQHELPQVPSREASPATKVMTVGVLAELSLEDVNALMPAGFAEREFAQVDAAHLHTKLKKSPAKIISRPACLAKGTWRIIFDASEDRSGEMIVVDFITTDPELGLFFRADLNLMAKGGEWHSSVNTGNTAGRAGVATAWETSDGRWMLMAFDLTRVD